MAEAQLEVTITVRGGSEEVLARIASALSTVATEAGEAGAATGGPLAGGLNAADRAADGLAGSLGAAAGQANALVRALGGVAGASVPSIPSAPVVPPVASGGGSGGFGGSDPAPAQPSRGGGGRGGVVALSVSEPAATNINVTVNAPAAQARAVESAVKSGVLSASRSMGYR